MKKLIILCGIWLLLFTPCYSQIPSYVPTNGLAGWWPFNSNANDESNNGHNGTVFGATLTTDRFGNSNSAYLFNGLGDYIESTDAGMPAGTDAYSFNTWIYLNQPSNNSWCTILSYGTNNNTNSDDGKSSQFWITSNTNTTQLLSNDYRNRANRGTVDSLNYRGAWHMITFIKPSADTLGNWYYDGQPIPTSDQNSNGVSRNILLSGVLRIGKSLNSTPPYQYYWNGKLDDIGMWNRALTQQEITNLYTASTLTPCNPLVSNLTSGLVGYWPFCGDATDQSGNGNNGVVNGATLTFDRFGNANAAYSFDGLSSFIEVAHSQSLTFNSSVSFSFWLYQNDFSLGSVSLTERTPIGKINSSGTGLSFETVDNIGTCCGAQFYLNDGATLVQYEDPAPMPINTWVHLVGTYDGTTLNLYQNNVLLGSATGNLNLASNTENLFFGKEGINNRYYFGKIDDICIWNRALTLNEITQLYTGSPCVSYQTITVTDTLIINANLTSVSPVTFANTIKVYPNPAMDHITIDFGANYTTLNGYTIRIDNSLSQTVYSTTVSQQSNYVDLNTWTGNGVYFIYLYDTQGHLIDVRKIIIQ